MPDALLNHEPVIRLAAFSGVFALSDILRLIRLKICVYFQSDFSPPWGMEMEAGPFAQFHVVVRGQWTANIAFWRPAMWFYYRRATPIPYSITRRQAPLQGSTF